MKSLIKLLIVVFFLGGVMSLGSCKKKDGCYTEEYYRKTNSPAFFKKKNKRKTNTLFSKKHQKRMKK